MTSHDYHMTMNVRIAEFKARLSQYLWRVRRGQTLTILDRDTPVTRVTPINGDEVLTVREPLQPSRRLQDVPLPPPLELDLDIVDLLMEERQGDR